jgi:hypothetical protein
MSTLLRCMALVVSLGTLGVSTATAQRGSPAGTTAGGIDPLAQGSIHNIVDWDGGALPRRYERSNQLPMSLLDVSKLSASDFSDEAIIRMIQERQCACDASVDALVSLKEAGVSEGVIQAVSLHALPPNRSLFVVVTIDFEGLGGASEVSTQARRGYIYLIIPDGDRERVFMADLQSVVAGRWQQDEMVDGTDLMLERKVRRVTFAAEVPLKTYGPRTALVFASTRPNIFASRDIPKADQVGVQRYEIDYPSSSLQRICDLQVLYRQDQMLPDQWHLVRTNFQCEWE